MPDQPFMYEQPFEDGAAFASEQPSEDTRPFMSDQAPMPDQPFRDARPSMSESSNVGHPLLWGGSPPAWESDLDALLRPVFIVTPPPEAQQAILAAVLQAAGPRTVRAPVFMPRPESVPTETASPQIPLVAYLLLAAVLVAYAAALSWAQTLLDPGGWLPTLAAQILAASESVVGPLPVSEPLALTWLILQRAPWLALLPLAWLLWERDRASSAQAA